MVAIAAAARKTSILTLLLGHPARLRRAGSLACALCGTRPDVPAAGEGVMTGSRWARVPAALVPDRAGAVMPGSGGRESSGAVIPSTPLRVPAAEAGGGLAGPELPLGLGAGELGPGVLGEGDPLGEGDTEPVGEGDAEPVGEGDAEPVGEGDAEPVGDGDAEPVGEGEAEPVGDGDADPVAEGGGELAPGRAGPELAAAALPGSVTMTVAAMAQLPASTPALAARDDSTSDWTQRRPGRFPSPASNWMPPYSGISPSPVRRAGPLPHRPAAGPAADASGTPAAPVEALRVQAARAFGDGLLS
jgi:hypothetical protein